MWCIEWAISTSHETMEWKMQSIVGDKHWNAPSVWLSGKLAAIGLRYVRLNVPSNWHRVSCANLSRSKVLSLLLITIVMSVEMKWRLRDIDESDRCIIFFSFKHKLYWLTFALCALLQSHFHLIVSFIYESSVRFSHDLQTKQRNKSLN